MMMGAVVFHYSHMDPTQGGVNRHPEGKISLARFPDGRQMVSFHKSIDDGWTQYHGHWQTLMGHGISIHFKYTGRDDALVQHIFHVVDPPARPDQRGPTFDFQTGARHWFAHKKERLNGPTHTIYLTMPQFLAYTYRQWPSHRLLDIPLPRRLLDIPLHMQVEEFDDWVYLAQDPGQTCDDADIVQILDGPQWV